MASAAFFGVPLAQDSARGTREAQAENSARLAVSGYRVETRGSVARRIPDPIMFDVVFTEPPLMTSGHAIALDPDGSAGWVPQVSAGVWQWERSLNGHYTGAYVHLNVAVNGSSLGLVIEHHLVFMGVAYKDLGQAVTTEAQLLSPRPTGFGGSV